MIHSDRKMQQLIEQIHAAIRTFGNEHVVYDVVAKLGHYEVAVIMLARRIEFQVSYAPMDAPYWDDFQHNIVRAVIYKCIQQAPEVNHEDINYVLHPSLTLETM